MADQTGSFLQVSMTGPFDRPWLNCCVHTYDVHSNMIVAGIVQNWKKKWNTYGKSDKIIKNRAK